MKNKDSASEISPILYVTLAGEGHAEMIERKSRFIGHAAHVTNEEDAIAFINRIKSENTQANHNVYAYIIKENNIQRYSDDSEPKGTAGIPVLDIIRKNEFTDAVIVVTRYFGGVLLGAGGLVRAYSAAAKLAVDEARIVAYEKYIEFSMSISYSEYQKLQNDFSRYGIIVDSSDFSDEVVLSLAIKETDYDKYVKKVSEMTAGRVIPSLVGSRFDFR